MQAESITDLHEGSNDYAFCVAANLALSSQPLHVFKGHHHTLPLLGWYSRFHAHLMQRQALDIVQPPQDTPADPSHPSGYPTKCRQTCRCMAIPAADMVLTQHMTEHRSWQASQAHDMAVDCRRPNILFLSTILNVQKITASKITSNN